MSASGEFDNERDRSLTATYVRVVLLEAAIIVLLVIIGHLFS